MEMMIPDWAIFPPMIIQLTYMWRTEQKLGNELLSVHLWRGCFSGLELSIEAKRSGRVYVLKAAVWIFFYRKKDAYYQTMSQWKKEPMLHLMPHWNFQGQEGKRIRVVAYTNQPEVELWLNGKSLGRLKTPSFGYAQWDVPYEPGRLEAKAFQQNKVTVEAIQETTGAPTRLLLIREEMEPVFAEKGETLPLRCIALDKQGRYVPTASVKVNFSITGNGKILATGSDVCDHNPPKEMSRIMRAGIIAVLVGHFSGQKDTVIWR